MALHSLVLHVVLPSVLLVSLILVASCLYTRKLKKNIRRKLKSDAEKGKQSENHEDKANTVNGACSIYDDCVENKEPNREHIYDYAIVERPRFSESVIAKNEAELQHGYSVYEVVEQYSNDVVKASDVATTEQAPTSEPFYFSLERTKTSAKNQNTCDGGYLGDEEGHQPMYSILENTDVIAQYEINNGRPEQTSNGDSKVHGGNNENRKGEMDTQGGCTSALEELYENPGDVLRNPKSEIDFNGFDDTTNSPGQNGAFKDKGGCKTNYVCVVDDVMLDDEIYENLENETTGGKMAGTSNAVDGSYTVEQNKGDKNSTRGSNLGDIYQNFTDVRKSLVIS